MHRVQLHYTLGREAPAAGVRHPLIELLQAVADQGSISGAARGLGLSYRHAWGELKRWESELGNELIVWEKGQAARLTEFGAKLMWAERQAQARLAPQIEALRADLERTFAIAFDPQAHVLTFHASHDDALVLLREQAARLDGERLHLDIRFSGSVDAIGALNEGRCIMAGFHTRTAPPADSRAARTFRPLLQPGRHKLIGFARRIQGLIVAPGNPLGLHALADVARAGARMASRPLGSGTRVLLDELLDEAGLAPGDLVPHGEPEPSHAAVAQAVAAGAADAGLGTEAAARARGLDFVPLADEDYHLVCLKDALEQPPVQALRRLLATPAWAAQLAGLPGYRPSHAGEVLALSRLLPWWTFSRQKRAKPSAVRS